MNLRHMYTATVVKNKADVNNYIIHIPQAWATLLRLTNPQTHCFFILWVCNTPTISFCLEAASLLSGVKRRFLQLVGPLCSVLMFACRFLKSSIYFLLLLNMNPGFCNKTKISFAWGCTRVMKLLMNCKKYRSSCIWLKRLPQVETLIPSICFGDKEVATTLCAFQ